MTKKGNTVPTTDAQNVENPNIADTKPKFKKGNIKKDSKEIASKFPEHYVNIALLIKNNAEIRRFTALGIINFLLQKGEIKGTKRFVTFKWNKFKVICDGLAKEYSYQEPFFLNALTASFASFAASAQKTIDIFCKKEFNVGVNKAVDEEEVAAIVENNIQRMNETVETDNV